VETIVIMKALLQAVGMRIYLPWNVTVRQLTHMHREK